MGNAGGGQGQRWEHIQDCWSQWPMYEIGNNSTFNGCNTTLKVENENNTIVTSWKTCVNQNNTFQEEIVFNEWRKVTNYTNTELAEMTQNTTLYMLEGKHIFFSVHDLLYFRSEKNSRRILCIFKVNFCV